MERDIKKINKNIISSFIIEILLYFIFVITFFYKVRSFSFQEEHLLWPVFWLKYIDGFNVVMVLKGAAFLSPFLTLHIRTRKTGQFLTFLSIFLLLSVHYSNGKIYHSVLSWIYFLPTYFLCRLFIERHLAVHFSFFFFSLSYFNAGIWKLRAVAQHFYEGGSFTAFSQTLQEYVSYSALERVREPTFLGSIILENRNFSTVLWIFAILGELVPFGLIFSRKYTYLYALYFALFQIGIFLTLRINFITTIYLNLALAAYFYLERDNFLEKSKIPSSSSSVANPEQS